MATSLRENQNGLAEVDVKVLSLVDVLEPLSREELAGLNWKHLDTHVEQGVTFYTPMDLDVAQDEEVVEEDARKGEVDVDDETTGRRDE